MANPLDENNAVILEEGKDVNVIIKANTPVGMKFSKWVVVSGNVIIENETAETTKFKMINSWGLFCWPMQNGIGIF